MKVPVALLLCVMGSHHDGRLVSKSMDKGKEAFVSLRYNGCACG